MANKQISDFVKVTEVDNTDVFHLQKAGVDSRIEGSDLLAITSQGFNPVINTFTATTDFTAGTTTTLTLTEDVANSDNLDVFFDGVYQERSGYNTLLNSLVFTSAIPVGTTTVEVIIPVAVPINQVSAANVILSSGSSLESVLGNIRSVDPLNGGIEIDNRDTGSGFERALTTSDIISGGAGVVTVTAGQGLVNTGTSINPILDIGAGTGITVNATNIQVNQSQLDHTNFTNIGTNTHTQIDSHIADSTIHLNEEAVEDIVNGLLVNGPGITLNYNDVANTLTISSTAADQNLWSTISSDSGNTTANTTTDTLTVSGGTGISTSISGDVLTITNTLGGGSQNLWESITADSGGTATADTSTDILTLAGGTGLQTVRNLDTITFNAVPSGINHDGLLNFVANEHIDHSSVSIIAGNGLTGGGTIDTSKTLNIGAGTGITVNANDIAVNTAAVNHDTLLNFVANEHIDHSTVSINPGVGLTGGGSIITSRTINLDLSELTISNLDGDTDYFVTVDEGNNQQRVTKGNINISGFNNDAGFTSNIGDVTAVTAGNGLTGGGTSGALTLNIGQGVGIAVGSTTIRLDINNLTTNADLSTADFLAFNDTSNGNAQRKIAVSDFNSVLNHDTLANFVGNEHINHGAVSITGGLSLTGGGTITTSRSISLVNDLASPGNSKYYGTSSTGTKGFFDLPAGGGSFLSASKTATLPRNSTTISDDPDLTVLLSANTNYQIELVTTFLTFSSLARVTCEFGTPGGLSGRCQGLIFNFARTDGGSGSQAHVNGLWTDTFTNIGSAGAGLYSIVWSGGIRVGPVGAALTFRWASQTGDTIQLETASFIKATPLEN